MQIPSEQFFGITQGLPGSGKSTAAKRAIAVAASEGREIVEVNRDDIRKELGGYNRRREEKVRSIRDSRIRNALARGQSVICTDTNLMNSVVERHRHMAEDFNLPLVVFDEFLSVPVHRCIQQDLQREDSVGKDVIERMYYDYWGQFDTPPNVGETPTVICDIDGTLAHTSIPYPAAYDRDYRTDTLDPAVWELLNKIEGWEIILLSGRYERTREQTEEWLEDNEVRYHALFMRPDDRDDDDLAVKKDLYMQHIQNSSNYVVFVLDDRPRVVRMWRAELGLKCLQVGPNMEF